jgi:hypothetical protein
MQRMRHRLNWTKDPRWKNVKVSMDTINQTEACSRMNDRSSRRGHQVQCPAS